MSNFPELIKSRSHNESVLTYLRLIYVYIQRWLLTNVVYMLKNIISCGAVFFITCFAVKEDAYVYMEPTKSCIFSLLMCMIWSGIFNSIALFYSEANYTLDDLTKVLPARVYIISNVLIQFVLCIVETFVCVAVFSVMFRDYFDAERAFFAYSSNTGLDYGITFFLVIFSADMIGIALGVIVKNITTAMTILPVVLIIQFLLSGCLFDLNSGLLKGISRYTTAKWGFSAMGTLADLNHMDSRLAEKIPGYVAAENDLFGSNGDFIMECWTHMAILSMIFIVLAAILLYARLNFKGRR